MALEVREITEVDDLRTAARTDLFSFGRVFDEGFFEETLELRRTTTSYLAEIDGSPAGSCLVHPFDITLPGGTSVGLSGIGDVGVLPSHRRRGVLSTMMDRMLADGAAAGHVAAGLYASEPTIYGRFGFGAATRELKVRIDTRRAAMRAGAPVADGGVEVIHPEDRIDVLEPIHRKAITRRPGEVSRNLQRWMHRLGGYEHEQGNLMCLAHRSPAGGLDAYALYVVRADWRPSGPEHELEVVELFGLDAGAELAMWQAVLQLDLIRTVVAWIPGDGLLFDVLADRWAPDSVGQHDGLWLRLLDVPAALAGRTYRTQTELVIDVVDHRQPSGATAAGTWRLVTDASGAGRIERSTQEPDLRLGVAELGSVVLGGGSLARLSEAGRVEELADGALQRADAAFGWWPSPWITEFF